MVRKRMAVLTVLVLLAAGFCLPAQSQKSETPLTEDQARALIKKNKNTPDVILKTLDQDGVDFDLNRDIEKKMRKAGATDAILQAIWKAGPTSRMSTTPLLTSATGATLQATYQEVIGFETIQNEPDLGRKLNMVDEFQRRFPQSQLLSYVDTQAARACQEKGDFKRAIQYGEASLKLDPRNFYSMDILALTLARPGMNQGGSQNLSQAVTYANRVLQLVPAVPKRPKETDADSQKRKNGYLSDAHYALGLARMLQNNLADAISEYKIAISLAPNLNPQIYYRLGEVYANNGNNAEAVEALTRAAQLGHGTVIEEYANRRLSALKMTK